MKVACLGEVSTHLGFFLIHHNIDLGLCQGTLHFKPIAVILLEEHGDEWILDRLF